MELIIFLVLVGLGVTFWTIAEKKHYKSILKREDKYINLPCINEWELPESIKSTFLVNWSTVVSLDYFKKMIFSFINFFWGRVTSFETLLDRARRESILRMKEIAVEWWADMIANMRIETSSISKWNKDQVGSVEVLVYWTAVVLDK